MSQRTMLWGASQALLVLCETHRPVSYETAWPQVSVGYDRVVMSAVFEKDVMLGGEISRVLHKPEI